MKNSNKFIVGLFILFLAFTVSISKASKNNHLKKSNGSFLVLFDYLVQRTPEVFNPLSDPLSVPDFMMCAGSASHNCTYALTLFGKLFIPNQSSYSAGEIDIYLANGWLLKSPESRNALYWD